MSDVKNVEVNDTNKYKCIILHNGIEDYFENENFLIEKYAQEIDMAAYNGIVDRYKINIDLTKRLPLQEGLYKILLQNGDSVLLENEMTPSSDAMITYKYIGFIPKIYSYLFEFTSYEGWGYQIISEKDGRNYFLRDMPYFSPNVIYFSTVRIDEEGITCGTIELYKADFTQTNLLFGMWSYDILPIESCWKTDNELYFKAYKSTLDRSQIKYYKLEVK